MFEVLAHQLEFVSLLGGEPLLIALVLGITVIFLLSKEHYKTSIIALSTSASLMYSLFLKQLFKHPRPQGAPEKYFNNFDIYGFPSTHVIFYTVFWGFIFYLTFKYKKEAKLFLHVIRWISAYMVASVGASRIFLGVHYLKDVVGGYIFGLFFILLLIWADGMLSNVPAKNKKKNKK